ncbi:DUF2304 domain-containing protein [Candidatus Uhrbacteria bacterium]|nr:DUF2304 domain-containing protein [Candidatus Uhrbacteria bacterium]
MIIKIILLSFIVFAVFRLLLRRRGNAISVRWLILWLIFWLAAGIVVAIPETTTRLANLVGIGRGSDLAVYLAVLGIYYLAFRLMVRVEKMERDISKITEELAIRENQEVGIKK